MNKQAFTAGYMHKQAVSPGLLKRAWPPIAKALKTGGTRFAQGVATGAGAITGAVGAGTALKDERVRAPLNKLIKDQLDKELGPVKPASSDEAVAKKKQ
jgi:hypothetical protein